MKPIHPFPGGLNRRHTDLVPSVIFTGSTSPGLPVTELHRSGCASSLSDPGPATPQAAEGRSVGAAAASFALDLRI